MPYGIGRMMRLRGGLGLGLPGTGCAGRRVPLGRGLIGTAASILAGLALNDLANPQGYLRKAVRQLMHSRQPVKVIGFEPEVQEGDRKDQTALKTKEEK